MWRSLALGCLLAVAAQSPASSSGSPAPTAQSSSGGGGDLAFGPVDFAGYANYVLRDNTTAAQVVLSNDPQPAFGQAARLITAFPRANTGALAYFVPTNEAAVLSVSLDEGSLRSLSGPDEQRGVAGSLTFNNDFRLGVSLLGSVRTLRDYTESGGKTTNPLFNYTLGAASDRRVELVRRWLNGSTVQYLSFEAGANAGLAVTRVKGAPPGVRFRRLDNRGILTVTFQSHFNWTGTTPETPYVETSGLGKDGLFLKPTGAGGSAPPGGRPMAESTAVITATSWPAGPPNPIFTMHANQTRASPDETDRAARPNTTVPNPPPSSQQTPAAARGAAANVTAEPPPPLVNATSNSAAANVERVLAAIRRSGRADEMAFLAYDTEFLAGGWRFLTYFGRDTLIAARLLLPVLAPEAVESVLAAAIERTNGTSGELCHEETVGDYASWLNAQAGQPERGNQPVYAYTMVDTDFLLLPLLASYAGTPQSQGRLEAFLARNSTLVPGSFKDLLELNAEHVLDLARDFAQHPARKHLVAVRSYPVGNWRDSAYGLGNGTYPFDVNVALVPAALRAAAALADAGLIDAKFAKAGKMARRWEARALKYFHVRIAHAKAAQRLDAYVAAANLSDALLYGAGSLNGTRTAAGYNAPGWAIGVPNATSPDAGSGSAERRAEDEEQDEDGEEDGGRPSSAYPEAERDTYYAVALAGDFRPVHVQHSDLAFLLLYGDNVSPKAVRATVQALQPYPRGLLTNAGMLVANPAFSWDERAADLFSNRRYHGAVAWSFQQGMMAAGVARQLALCGAQGAALEQATLTPESQPDWCHDRELVTALHAAQGRLWDSIAGSRDVLYTEVWSPVFVPAPATRNSTAAVRKPANGTAGGGSGGSFAIGDLGKLAPEGTEGNAVQLWSYGFLAQIDPRTGTPVAEWASGNGGSQPAAQEGQQGGSDQQTKNNDIGSAKGVGGVTNATTTSVSAAA